MIELKNGKLCVTAIVTDMKSGNITGLSFGDALFERTKTLETVKVAPRGIMAVPDRGARVMQISGNWVYKNVLDECKHAKTWADIKPIVVRYYPNCGASSITLCRYSLGVW